MFLKSDKMGTYCILDTVMVAQYDNNRALIRVSIFSGFIGKTLNPVVLEPFAHFFALNILIKSPDYGCLCVTTQHLHNTVPCQFNRFCSEGSRRFTVNPKPYTLNPKPRPLNLNPMCLPYTLDPKRFLTKTQTPYKP